MDDFKFIWYKSIEIGVPNIDDQHKELFRIGRHIHQVLLRDFIGIDTDQLLDIISEFQNYITYNFYEEESLMQEISYPNFLSHKDSHSSFIKEINSIDYNNLHVSLKSLEKLLKKWAVEHLLVDDYAIKKFIIVHTIL